MSGEYLGENSILSGKPAEHRAHFIDTYSRVGVAVVGDRSGVFIGRASLHGSCVDEVFKLYARLYPLMKYTNILSFNWRTIALFASLFAGMPWLYFAFELIVLNTLLIYMVLHHELAVAYSGCDGHGPYQPRVLGKERRGGVFPQAITIASIFLGVGAGIAFYFNNIWINVAGMLLLMWANSFDSAGCAFPCLSCGILRREASGSAPASRRGRGTSPSTVP